MMTMRTMRRPLRQGRTGGRMRGQSTIEYLVVLLFAVIVLVTGTDPPIQKLATAIRDYYTDYSFAISVSSMPNCFNSAGVGPVTVSVDKCIDLKDPQWPVDVSFN